MKYIVRYTSAGSDLFLEKAIDAADPDEAVDIFLSGFSSEQQPSIYNVVDAGGYLCRLKSHTIG